MEIQFLVNDKVEYIRKIFSKKEDFLQTKFKIPLNVIISN